MIKLTLTAVAASALVAATPALARPMTATDMHMMHRLGSPSISPDGRYALFTLSTTDLAKNKRSNPVHLLDLRRPGATPQSMASLKGAHDATFGADGAIYYLSAVKERDQLFRMPMGSKAVQLSDFGADISGFQVSASGNRVIVWADRPDCPDLACAATTLPAKGPGSARVYDQMFVRHWDSWVEPGTKSRIYSFPLVNGRLGREVRVTGNLVGNTPSKPFGGGEEIALSPDGRMVYFALREAGRIEPTSTNLDIFASPADGSSAPVNLTDANDGTDTLPTLSPDGRTLAYVSMARAGYEADR
ncbi:MAG: S9 family peptidase, partial [Pseudomonadota bacterium]|nr:S9 family peptidase [Pseudomonadota bacterium]